MKTLNLIKYLAIALVSINSSFAASFFPSPLISAEWLSANFSDDIIILDARKDLESFIDEGHIEGAILVDNKKVRVDQFIDSKKLSRMRPNAQQFEQFMQQHGVNSKSPIVITHMGKTAGQVAGATRLYWHLKTYKVNNVAILDGGNAAWEDALEDLINEPTHLIKGDFKITGEDLSTLAFMSDVKAAITDERTQLIDSRDLRYHIGLNKKSYVFDYGHIPSSKILYYKFLNPLKGTMVFEPNDKIKQALIALNIDVTGDKIIYCNSAYEASAVWFALHELLGLKNTKIYDGSLHQWTQYPENKLVKTLSPI